MMLDVHGLYLSESIAMSVERAAMFGNPMAEGRSECMANYGRQRDDAAPPFCVTD